MPPSATRSGPANTLGELMEAIRDHHGQIDLRIEHLALRLPRIEDPVEVNGVISITVHLRGISDEEKRALTSREVKALSG